MADDVVARFNELFTVAPQLVKSPEIAVPMVTSGVPASEMKPLMGSDQGRKLTSYLQSLSPDEEIKEWDRLSKSQQSLARMGGYAEQMVRDEEEEKKGWGAFLKGVASIPFGQIKNAGSALGDAVDVAWDYSLKPTIDAVGSVVDLTLGSTLDAVAKASPDAIDKPLSNALDWTVDNSLGTVVDSAKMVGSQALDAYGYVTSKIDQTWRAGALNEDVPNLGPVDALPYFAASAGVVQGILTGDIARLWDEADRKNAPISKGELRKVEQEYGEEFVSLVRRQQGDPEALLQMRADFIAAGRTEDAQNLDNVMNSPEFGEVADRLGKALLSPGRNVAQELGLSDNDTAFNVVSGLGDGVHRIITDPLLAGGRVVQGGRVAAYGLPKTEDAAAASSEVFRLFQKRSVRNYWDGVAKNLEGMRSTTPGARQEALKDLQRNYKLMNPALTESMLKAGVNDVDGAMIHLMDTRAYMMLLEGQSAIRRPLMPYRRQIDLAVGGRGVSVRPGLAAKKPFHKVIDFMADGSKIVKDDLLVLGTQMDDLVKGVQGSHGYIEDAHVTTPEAGTGAGSMGQVRARTTLTGDAEKVSDLVGAHRLGWRGRTATAHRRISAKLPSVDEDGLLDLMAPGASRDVGRVAKMFAPNYWAREIETAFMQADEVGRKNIWKGLMATMGESAGITKTVSGREFWDEYLGTVAAGKSSVYSATGASRLESGRDVGLWAGDMSSKVAVPNFAEVYAQSAKIGVSDRMFGAVNREMVDLYMQSVWRPAVLLRPALAYRNSIEETLNQLVREPGAWTQGKIVSRAVNQRQYALKQRAQENAVSLKVQLDGIHSELTAKYGRDAWELGALQTEMRAEAEALRTARQGAGRKASDAPRVDRELARNERKIGADVLTDNARKIQGDINRLASAKHDANLARVRSEAMGDGFDSAVGRTFRALTSPPRALARTLAPYAEREGASDSLKAIHSTLRNANQSMDHFYRAHVYGKLADKMVLSMSDDVQKYVEELVDNPAARRMFEREVFETSKMSAGNVIDNLSVAPARKGYKTVTTGDYMLMDVAGQEGAVVWSNRLNYIAGDKAGAHVLAHIDDEYEAILGAARIIESNPGSYARRSMAMTERDSIEHATAMFKEAKAMVSTREGDLIPQIVDNLYYPGANGGRVLNADALSMSNLNKVDDMARPAEVVGSKVKFVEGASGMGAVVHELTQWGFKAVGDATAAMSRHNQFFSSYIQARQMLAPLEKDLFAKMGGDPAAMAATRAMMIDDAINQALVKATSFVDNPAVRSQAAVLVRNFAPFYRAQEEFFARWAKTFKYNPEAFGRALLGVHAAKSAGIVHKDENGDLFFVYPGSGVVHSMMATVSRTLGMDLTRMPIISPMTGKVQMLTPGFNPDGTLHIVNGPVFAEPLRQLARMTKNPTVDQWEKRLLGPGADRGLIHANVPAILRPAYEEYALDSDRHEINAMAALFAGGHGLPTNATSKEKREFLDRVKGHAHGLKVIRSIFGPAAPAYPRISPEQPPSEAAQAAGMNSVRQEFYDLVKRLDGDYNAAYAHWVETNPDELPFILGQSEMESVPFLSTKEAGEFIKANSAMLRNYPKAGSFFIPKGSEDFDPEAFRLSKQLGLRQDKSTEDFLDDLLRSNGIGFFYKERQKITDRVEAAKKVGDTVTAQHWNDVWSGWSKEYLALNPEVAEYQAAGGSRDNERKQTLTEMKSLLESGEAPEGETADMYRQLIRGWDKHVMNIEMIGDARTDYLRSQKEAENQAFSDWVGKLTENSTAGKLLYNRLFQYLKP